MLCAPLRRPLQPTSAKRCPGPAFLPTPTTAPLAQARILPALRSLLPEPGSPTQPRSFPPLPPRPPPRAVRSPSYVTTTDRAYATRKTQAWTERV